MADSVSGRGWATENRALLIVLAVAGGAMMVAVFGCGVAAVFLAGRGDPAAAGPSAARDGAAWSHRDLRDYLASLGVDYRMKSLARDVYFVAAAWPPESDDGLVGAAHQGVFTGDVVLVRATGGPQEARDLAGRRPNGTLAWGRFYFRGDAAQLGRIAAALK